jgi:uncharacterized YigZ family protein
METFTIIKDCQTEFTIEKSRFICNLKKVRDEKEAQEFIKATKKQYWDASHNCSAYVISDAIQRSSDDGEPSGTAGVPMLEVLRKRELYGVAAVVSRYFGGIKLGAGGLVRAYTNSVAQAVAFVGVARQVPVGAYTFQTGSAAAGKLLNLLHTCPLFTVQDVDYKERVTFTLQFPVEDLPHVHAWMLNHLQQEIELQQIGTSMREVPVTE